MSLSGEAGIGKSRLTAALLERLAAEPHTRLRYSVHHNPPDSALYSIISQMERAAGFAHGDAAQTKLKLDTLLAQSLTPRQDVAIFAEMLSLPNDGRHPTLELASQQVPPPVLAPDRMMVGDRAAICDHSIKTGRLDGLPLRAQLALPPGGVEGKLWRRPSG